MSNNKQTNRCLNCGNPTANKRKIYCSHKCYAEARWPLATRKYKKVEEVWFRKQCFCGRWIQSLNQKQCKQCWLNSIKGKVRVVHNKPHSTQSLIKISKNRKGKGLHPGINFSGQSGSSHRNWKGGISPINMLIRSSFEYKQWRKAVFERDDYTCQSCYSRGGIVLNADHIKPFANYPNLRFNLTNGRTLCTDCHRKTPTYGGNVR